MVEMARRMAADAMRVSEEMDEEIARLAPELGADPALARETALSTRAVMARWLSASINDPEATASTEPPPETREIVTSMTRRGIPMAPLISAFRAAQNVALIHYLRLAGELIEDREQLLRVLGTSLATIFEFVDGVLARSLQEAQLERDKLLAGGSGPKVVTLRLILDGAPVDAADASARLGYDLSSWNHTALFLWSADEDTPLGEMATTADRLNRAAGGRRPLIMPAGGDLTWAWIATPRDQEFDADAVRAAIKEVSESHRVAFGPTRANLAGFRSSHLALADAQRTMRFGPGEQSQKLTTWDEIQVVALAGRDRGSATEFTSELLGGLDAVADPSGELRRTLRTYLKEGSNAPRTAKVLHLHRNTVLNRVQKASELMGSEPAGNRLAVMLALELDRIDRRRG